MLNTTLNKLRAAGACRDRYAHLLAALGGPSVDHDAPITMEYILDTNGLYDALWALQATQEPADALAREFASQCAERALPIWESTYPEDMRPRISIATARNYGTGQTASSQLSLASAANAARTAPPTATMTWWPAVWWARAASAEGQLAQTEILRTLLQGDA